jgi:toxin YoeB
MKDITFTPEAYTNYISWLEKDRKIILKITSLIREVAKTPESGTGKSERLKHD